MYCENDFNSTIILYNGNCDISKFLMVSFSPAAAFATQMVIISLLNMFLFLLSNCLSAKTHNLLRAVILFLGACTSPPRLSLVTEYMEMGSLYYLIHASGLKKKLSWQRRLKMLCDICRCVAEFQSLFHFLSLCLELLAHQNSMLNLATIRPIKLALVARFVF